MLNSDKSDDIITIGVWQFAFTLINKEKVAMNNWKRNYQQIKIDTLHLDLRNPRTDSGGNLSETDVIKELLDENVIELAEDIVKNGYAPTSILMAIEEEGEKVVIEGNRRLMALKLIQDPHIIKDLAPASKFEKAKELNKTQSEDLSSTTVILYPDRKTAERDMAKLHLSGVAIQQWKLIRQYRYFQKRLDDDQLSIDTLADLLALDKGLVKKGIKTYQLYDLAKSNLPELAQELSNELGYDIFSDQYFKTDKFQKAVVQNEGERFLGYTFSETTQQILVEDEAVFFSRLEQVLREIFNPDAKFLASAQFSAKDRSAFFQSIEPSFLPDPEYKKAKREAEEKQAPGQDGLFESDKPKMKPVTGSKPIIPKSDDKDKEKGTKPKPDWVVTADVNTYAGATRVKDILEELRKNPPENGKNANILAVTLRVVVELAIYSKLSDMGIIEKMIQEERDRVKEKNARLVSDGKPPSASLKPNWSPSLKQMIAYMISEANTIIKDPQDKKTLEKVTQKWKSFVDDMDYFIHNVSYNPRETTIRDLWKTFISPVFDILKKI